MESSRKASGGKKPFWFVCQAFNFGKEKKVPRQQQRFPTRRELRTMTYTAIACGARGILYWCSMAMMIDRWNHGYLTRVRNWERLKSVTLELKQLLPVLTADTAETFQSKNHVAVMVKGHGRDLYIIAANYERRPTKTVIDLPGIRQGTAEVMFDKGTAQIRDGRLTASFEPVESRVYRIPNGQHMRGR